MLWPMNVATKAPAIPSTMVTKKPGGLFGPGSRKRAIRPARRPISAIQMMPGMTTSQFFRLKHIELGLDFAFLAQRRPRSVGRLNSLRLVHRLLEMPTRLGKMSRGFVLAQDSARCARRFLAHFPCA